MSPTDSNVLSNAFIFGFPLVFNLDQVHRYVTTGIGANPAAPFNTFSHARTLAGPADTFVSINNDTVYSMAQIDLSVGPVLLETPDTGGRYFVLQFVDAWTNNFAYVGHRATGTEAQRYLLVPPGWEGEAPADARVIHAPTLVFSIVGRWACQGDWDLPAVHALQDATTLTPLNSSARAAGLPEVAASVPPELVFLEKFRLWSQAFASAPNDQAHLQAFESLGITTPGDSPYSEYPAAVVANLGAELESARNALIDYLRTGEVPIVNGWQLPYHAFDYNTDFFEIGTINDPLYTAVSAEQKYILRAAAAMGGLWGNHAYEAAYAAVYVDGDGAQLTGENTYTLTLNPLPPVNAFWSLTMYAAPDFFLVDNSIDRYSIGSNTEGLVFGEDGSLTITMSSTQPTNPDERANWLPAPRGEFRPMLRMYEPDSSVINGEFEIPPIIRRG